MLCGTSDANYPILEDGNGLDLRSAANMQNLFCLQLQYVQADDVWRERWRTPTAAVGGTDTQCIFMDGATPNGDAGCTYNKTTNVLTATGGFVSTCDFATETCINTEVHETTAPADPTDTGRCTWGFHANELKWFCGGDSLKSAVDAGAAARGRLLCSRAMPPATAFATLDVRAGGSTPAEQVEVFDFDDTTAEHMDFLCELTADYAGGGLSCVVTWSATTATTGAVQWELAFRRLADDAEDIDTSQTYDFNTVSTTTASASGEVQYSTIAFTHGADMDSLAAGEVAILRLRRNPAGTDDLTGDAELWHRPLCTEP
jgi:hypothetical protein